MAVSKSQQKAVNKYIKEKYDRINVNMPKGKKEIIQEYAEKSGMSVNAFINHAIDREIEIRSGLACILSAQGAIGAEANQG